MSTAPLFTNPSEVLKHLAELGVQLIGVADDSRELILKVARELGYVPNRAAQALRRSSRDSVAVITAHASNSYYLNLMSGIQHMLQPSQWTVVLGDIAVNGIYDRTQEDRMINRLIESRMAGIISTAI